MARWFEAGEPSQARLDRVLGALSAFAGRPLDIDQAIFESERDTGHRNRAIGHLLRNHGILTDDPEPALELYFRQCAIRMNCRQLARAVHRPHAQAQVHGRQAALRQRARQLHQVEQPIDAARRFPSAQVLASAAHAAAAATMPRDHTRRRSTRPTARYGCPFCPA